METNNHQINDYSAVLERKYGKHGTQERAMITPSVATFYRIMNALGMRVEVVKPII